MKTNKKYLKAFMLSLGLAGGLLLSVSATAQSMGGGVFGYGNGSIVEPQRDGVFDTRSLDGGYSLHNQQFGADNGGYNLYNQTFGQDTPLGSGLFIVAVAGAAYAFRKRKKNN
ncbi:MAG: hypothetical protein II887_02870 [Bacteroidales bacterium]|nr:hypothetical protein [Bacteroidales bacterium]